MKVPLISATINFLKSDGWIIADETEKYSFLKPPKHIKFNYEFRFKIPKHEGNEEFKEYMTRLGRSIAEMYQWKKTDMLDLLSKDPVELKKDIAKHEKEIQQLYTLKNIKEAMLGEKAVAA